MLGCRVDTLTMNSSSVGDNTDVIEIVLKSAGCAGCFTLGTGVMMAVFHQWLKWFCEAGGHMTKTGWSKPHNHSNPTNLALFRHKITLYRCNQGGSYYCRGLKWEHGAEPPPPTSPHFNHCLPLTWYYSCNDGLVNKSFSNSVVLLFSV